MDSNTNTFTQDSESFRRWNTSLTYIDRPDMIHPILAVPLDLTDNDTIGNTTSQNESYMFSELLILLYVVQILLGTILHTCIIYLISSRPAMREKFIFTTSISVAHVLFCVLVLPLLIAFHSTNEEKLKTPCNVIVCFLIGVTSYSILTTAVRRFVALLERFRFINFTYEGKMKNLVLIWIVSLGLAVPYFASEARSLYDILPQELATGNTKTNDIFNGTGSGVNSSKHMGTIDGANETQTVGKVTSVQKYTWILAYNTLHFAVQIILPSLVSLVLNILTLRLFLRRPNQRHWVVEKRITKQHIITIVILLITWVPVSIINLIHDYVSLNPRLVLCLQAFSVNLISYYPLMICFVNPHINKEFRKWLRTVASRINLGTGGRA